MATKDTEEELQDLINGANLYIEHRLANCKHSPEFIRTIMSKVLMGQEFAMELASLKEARKQAEALTNLRIRNRELKKKLKKVK